MIYYVRKLSNQLKKFIKEGIEKKELIPEAINLVDGLMIFEKGMALLKMTQDDFDSKFFCETFINTIFDLIEVKNDR